MTKEALNKHIAALLDSKSTPFDTEVRQLLTDFLAAVLPSEEWDGTTWAQEPYWKGKKDTITQIKTNAEMLLRGETE